MPGPAETVNALAIGFALGVVAREAVQRQSTERHLQYPTGTAQDPEVPVHTGASRELGFARAHGERRPELQALAALAQEMMGALGAQRVERVAPSVDRELLAELGVGGRADRDSAAAGESERRHRSGECQRH